MLKWGNSVIGLDCSTKSIAYCKIVDGEPRSWGEIKLNGSNAFERIHDAKLKMSSLGLKADHVAIESAVYVNNVKASILLAYVYGAVLGELMDSNSQVFEVVPTQWQSHIGNKTWTKDQKKALEKEVPGKSVTWYKNEMRNRRKQFTMDWVKTKYGILVDSDNVGDAFGLATYVKDTYTDA